MPKLLTARLPGDADEEREVHKLAGSRHAPGDRIFRARIVHLSWQGLRTAGIAEEPGCHPKTVGKRLHRFNAEGMDGLGDRAVRRRLGISGEEFMRRWGAGYYDDPDDRTENGPEIMALGMLMDFAK